MVKCNCVYTLLERNPIWGVLKAHCQSSAFSKGLNVEVGKFCRHLNGVYGQQGLWEEHGKTSSMGDGYACSWYSNEVKLFLRNERFVSCSDIIKSSTVRVVVCTSAKGQAMPWQLWHTPVRQEKLYYDGCGVHQSNRTGCTVTVLCAPMQQDGCTVMVVVCNRTSHTTFCHKERNWAEGPYYRKMPDRSVCMSLNPCTWHRVRLNLPEYREKSKFCFCLVFL